MEKREERKVKKDSRITQNDRFVLYEIRKMVNTLGSNVLELKKSNFVAVLSYTRLDDFFKKAKEKKILHQVDEHLYRVDIGLLKYYLNTDKKFIYVK